MTAIVENPTKSPLEQKRPAIAVSMASAGILCAFLTIGLSGCLKPASTGPVVCKECIPTNCKAVIAPDGRVYYVKLLPGETAGKVENGK